MIVGLGLLSNPPIETLWLLSFLCSLQVHGGLCKSIFLRGFAVSGQKQRLRLSLCSFAWSGITYCLPLSKIFFKKSTLRKKKNNTSPDVTCPNMFIMESYEWHKKYSLTDAPRDMNRTCGNDLFIISRIQDYSETNKIVIITIYKHCIIKIIAYHLTTHITNKPYKFSKVWGTKPRCEHNKCNCKVSSSS